ncbi:UNVERIFIED_CONTAM: putative ribonuclease H protein, partial [Sesamum radiatum]
GPNMYYFMLTLVHRSLTVGVKGTVRNLQVSLFRFDNFLALSLGSLNLFILFGGTLLLISWRSLKNILQLDRHISLLLLLEHCCRLVYLKASKLEQVMLRQSAKMQWLKGGDQCSRVFFQRVATRELTSGFSRFLMTMAMNKQTQPLLTVSLWIFSRVCWVGDRTDRAMDLQYLRPWARHILTDDEARTIIRPVTSDEVKTAFFDIEEDKAPGPDRFSSGFFKAAWSVVGEEVSKAITDFFKTGRLLKQLNATLLTLIPKVRNPQSVVESGLYVVAMLSTKLLPRSLCALKVDLRKAYDTVEWDFLFATLRMFGFPAVFIGWIKECVTSAHYSVMVNGEVHGFFAGARGLRQGDPMSPYLFVLVMEVLHMILQQFIEQDGEFRYHWRCQDLNLFQLSFADDLLLFSSGLRESLLAALGFQEGHLPVRYLGLPLISARLSVTDCQSLLQKIDSRIKGWEGVQLSFAGRVQLIKSVLTSFEVYWATAFILPKGIIKEMIKRLRTFLWKGTYSSGYPKVAWETVCLPIEEGDLGIKDILALNRALMSKHLWAVINRIGHLFGLIGSSRFDFGTVQFGQLRITKELGAGGRCYHFDIL